jgi:hypothetical protein
VLDRGTLWHLQKFLTWVHGICTIFL